MLLQPYDLCVGAEAVPRRAVVDGLEVGGHNVAHGERGDDPLLRADRLHRVAARRARLQHRLLPRPRLHTGGQRSGYRSLQILAQTVSARTEAAALWNAVYNAVQPEAPPRLSETTATKQPIVESFSF